MNNVYAKIIRETKFDDYSSFNPAKVKFESKIRDVFSKNEEFEGARLIGSAATGTMRKNSGDLDYFVVFNTTVNNPKFKEIVLSSDLEIDHISEETIRYGYIRISGKFDGFKFVLVPVKNPANTITDYAQDAFYHADFINKRKKSDHTDNVLLLKAFFDKLGLYKTIQGISCELMALKYNTFDEVLCQLATKDKIRVNFSSKNENYSDNSIVIDYPFLGGRSLVKPLTLEDYLKIQKFAKDVLEDPNNLLREPN